jgi:hypothetical protein
MEHVFLTHICNIKTMELLVILSMMYKSRTFKYPMSENAYAQNILCRLVTKILACR